MKILYTISTPYGLGADRWVFEGYKNAFLEEGHDFHIVTENDDFEGVVGSVRPDILMLDFGLFEKLFFANRWKIPEGFFEKIKASGTKIFASVHLPGADLEDPKDKVTDERINFYKKYIPLFDVCYNHNAPWSIERLESAFGRKFYFIPVAADSKHYFRDKPDKKYEKCDIAFVGSAFTQKKDRYEEWLFPLFKKYKVCLYGPGWTLKDRALRAAGHISRKIHADWLTKLIGDWRVTINPDEERKLYASSKICINLHESYKDKTTRGFTNDREFKVPASGGFQVSDYIPHLKMFFEPDKEIVLAKTPEEWFSKIDYYIKHEKERKVIQEAGTRRAMGEHTYRHRVGQIIDLHNKLKIKN